MKRSWQAVLPFVLVRAGAIQSSRASEPNLTAILANGKIQLSWPADFSHYFLLEASDLVPAAWRELVLPTLITNSTVRVTLDPADSARFFQLVRRMEPLRNPHARQPRRTLAQRRARCELRQRLKPGR